MDLKGFLVNALLSKLKYSLHLLTAHYLISDPSLFVLVTTFTSHKAMALGRIVSNL